MTTLLDFAFSSQGKIQAFVKIRESNKLCYSLKGGGAVLCVSIMNEGGVGLMLRLLSASVCAANKSGNIIRDILKTGKLGIVEKVTPIIVKCIIIRLQFTIIPCGNN